ncbi:MAG: GDP-L-fucose synthase [Fimbriimonadaceae bacterium]|nr:GDP-L-fucose synthase [Fimbriimonadaceae bacterium]QYK57154.1 MAG: GDP-L-fucose synthase [Fimbriimonadaceae bacterium]
MTRSTKIFLAGHRGLVGSAIHRRLLAAGFENVLTQARQELDLTDQAKTLDFLKGERPEWVVCAAALVGGIQANRSRPADFIGINLAIQQSVIWGSHLADIPNLMFLGSSCIYPKITPQPIREEALMTGPLEPTNAPYAVAKIAALTMCQALQEQYGRNYFTVMPPNVYGMGDNFDPMNAHVMGALIRRFHENLPDKPVTCWGTGSPKREFLLSDDLAEACVFLMQTDKKVPPYINVGTGKSISIKDLAFAIQGVTGHSGAIQWDTSMPDGFPEKTMDVSKIEALGWRHKTDVREGVKIAYQSFLEAFAGSPLSRDES